MALSLVVLWFSVPNMDVLGIFKKKKEAEEQRQSVLAVKADIKAKEDKLGEILNKAKVEMEDPRGDAGDEKPDPKDPDELRRAAVKKLEARFNG